MATTAGDVAGAGAVSFPLPHSWTLADLQRHLGGISADRVRLYPLPGTGLPTDADESDVLGSGLCELVDGVLVEKAMGTLESLVAMEIAFALRAWLEVHPLGVVLGADGLLQLGPQVVRGPDVSFIRWERFPGSELPKERVWAVAPDLAVEVLSPGNTAAEMERKVADYLGAGTQVVWIIDPATRTAAVHAPGAASGRSVFAAIEPAGELRGGAVLPGFTLALSKIFRGHGG